MKSSKALWVCSILTGLLALIASTAGLFWPAGDGQPYAFTSVRGVEAQLYGQGLYAYDTYFKAPILRGSDATILIVGLPLLLWALSWATKGRLRGMLGLAGVLSFFLYHAVSLAFGVFYNQLALVYVAYVSASLYAFILAFRAINVEELSKRVSQRAPVRGMAIFLFVAGLTVFVWLPDMIASLLEGTAPAGLAHYTTEVTYIIDPAIIAPSAFVASYLISKRRPMGFLMAPILLILNALVGVMVIGQTIFQAMAGIALTPAQLVAFVGSFTLMGLIAVWLLIKFFNYIRPPKREIDQ